MQKIMFNDKYGLTKAVLDGIKTQTRRLFTLTLHEGNLHNELQEVYPDEVFLYEGTWLFKYKGKVHEIPKRNCPMFKIGEVVAVAQSYKDAGYLPSQIIYRSIPEINGYIKEKACNQKGWNNKMFVGPNLMPHQIRITNVRVERLQYISDEDCLAEGIIKGKVGSEDTHFMDSYYIPNKPLEPICTPREAYAKLIDKVSGKGTWNKNPYVWVYDFELTEQKII